MHFMLISGEIFCLWMAGKGIVTPFKFVSFYSVLLRGIFTSLKPYSLVSLTELTVRVF
jgi:hypothetical protein